MATPLDTGNELRSDINVTPLVDVMLVLLVIFMVITPLLREELPVDLPEAEHAKSAEYLTQVTLSLLANGEIRLNGQAVERSQLSIELRSMFTNRPDKAIFLEADRSLAYGTVVDAMDVCRQAGLSQIGVLTQRAGTATP